MDLQVPSDSVGVDNLFFILNVIYPNYDTWAHIMGPVADKHGFGGRWRYNMVEGRKDMIVQLNPDTLTGY